MKTQSIRYFLFVVLAIILGSGLTATPASSFSFKRANENISSSEGQKILYFYLKSDDPQYNPYITQGDYYFRAKIAKTHVFYADGFLENIRKYVVTSQITYNLNAADSLTMCNLHAIREKQARSNQGEFLGISSMLVLPTPAIGVNLNIDLTIEGIGEDRFKKIFDVLKSSTFESALSLYQPAVQVVKVVSPILENVLQTDSPEPRPSSIMNFSSAFPIPMANSNPGIHDLKEGWIVFISSAGNNLRLHDYDNKVFNVEVRKSDGEIKLVAYPESQPENANEVNDLSYIIVEIRRSPDRQFSSSETIGYMLENFQSELEIATIDNSHDRDYFMTLIKQMNNIAGKDQSILPKHWKDISSKLVKSVAVNFSTKIMPKSVERYYGGKIEIFNLLPYSEVPDISGQSFKNYVTNDPPAKLEIPLGNLGAIGE